MSQKTFEPFRNASGEICCSDVDALCDTCKSKHAARTHRTASSRLPEYTPIDPYANDIAELRAANLRAEGVPDYPALRAAAASAIDGRSIPDAYAADTAKMREGYQR